METQALIDAINTKHATTFTLHGRFATGENQGAYALRDDNGDRYVLKWNERPSWLGQLSRAQHIISHLALLGVPVPRYVLIDSHLDTILYWIQTTLPGTPPKQLMIGHAEQLLALVERQAGQAFAASSDWSEYVRAVVFAGYSGWYDSLAQYNDETRAVLGRVKQIVAGKEQLALRSDDICHGDMGTDNALVEGDNVTGIVDWDAAGKGDRALDYSKLLFYSYRQGDVRELLRKHIVKISGQEVYVVYLAYNILAQLDWSIHHHSADSVTEGIGFANQILTDLEAFG